jgi:hypothetical protein
VEGRGVRQGGRGNAACGEGELHGRDGGHNDNGKRARRTPTTRSRSKSSCFSVKKLRSFLCAQPKVEEGGRAPQLSSLLTCNCGDRSGWE